MTQTTPSGTTRRERRAAEQKSARRKKIAIVAAAVLLIGAGAALAYFLGRDDGGDSAPSTSTSHSTRSTTTSLGVPTTTTGGAGSTTTTSGPGSTTTLPPPDPADPQAYADTLFQAWASGNRAQAAPVAGAAAIDTLFANPASEASEYTFSSCVPDTGTLYCSWTRPGGQLVMLVNDGTGGTTVQVLEVQIGPG